MSDPSVRYEYDHVQTERKHKDFRSLSDAFIAAWRDVPSPRREPAAVHFDHDEVSPANLTRAVLGAMMHAYQAGRREVKDHV